MLLLIILIVLLILSAFFSGSETAYFHLKTHRDNVTEKVKNLLKDPQKLLVTLLTGNTIVNVAIGSISALLALQIARNAGWPESAIVVVEVLIVSTVILAFGEIIPKLTAIRNSEKFAKIVNLPLRLFVNLLYPISIVFYGITRLMMKLFTVKKEKIFDTEEELKILAEVSEEQGTLKTEESEMIQSIFKFRDKTVHEIMTPRVDMVALSSTTSMDELMDIIKEKQFSKIPIFKNKIDNIRCILYAKDILPYLLGSRPKVSLLTLSREPFFVPESKNLDELLDDFKLRKTNIAIVVDEWGGTSGLVTLEDVVEEVIGEIRDPYDQEDSEIRLMKDGSHIVNGSVNIYDIEETLKIEFPEDRDYDTLGGFMFNEFGDIPKVEQFTEFKNRTFTVKHLDGNRIERVMISPEKCDVNKDDTVG